MTPKEIQVSDEIPKDKEIIAGRFLIELTKTGEVYITRKNDHYSAEYSAGRVDFRVKNEDIEILGKAMNYLKKYIVS